MISKASRKTFLYLSLVLLFCILVPAQPKADSVSPDVTFLQYVDDVPLMSGLFESTDETFIFEKPEGRIIKTTVLSETQNKQAIKTFYDQTLPELGWTVHRPNIYLRGDEKMTIEYSNDGSFTIVLFTLEPKF